MQLKLEYTRVERVLLRAPQVFGDKQIYLKLCKKCGHFYAVLFSTSTGAKKNRRT